MKKLQISPNYLIILLLVAVSMLLAACGTAADTASAASNDAVEGIVGVAEAVQKETQQEETAVNTDVANSDSDEISQAAPGNGYGANGNNFGQPAGDQGVHVPPTGELTDFEIEALQFMREEEKLARDVYLTLYEIWGTPIFSNIAGSEQAHMDAVAYLLEAYGLEDPAAGKAIGEFENSELQALYNQLVAQGQESMEDALLVGGAIEEIDILDLQENLAVIENPSVIQVFENLLRGSINHLKGFVRNYESQTGNSYGPQYMSQEAFEALIGSSSGQGNGAFTGSQNGSGRGGRGGGQGGNGGGQGGNGNGRGGRSG
jgi:hypothetical protein